MLPADLSTPDAELEATQRELQESGLQITGLRVLGKPGGVGGKGTSRFTGLYGSDDSSSDEEAGDGYGEDEDDLDEDDRVARDVTLSQDGVTSPSAGVGRRRSQRSVDKERRPSTTEAKQRLPLSDEDEEADDSGDLSVAMDRSLVLGHEESKGPFADPDEIEEEDDSSEEEMVEIRPRRKS